MKSCVKYKNLYRMYNNYSLYTLLCIKYLFITIHASNSSLIGNILNTKCIKHHMRCKQPHKNYFVFLLKYTQVYSFLQIIINKSDKWVVSWYCKRPYKPIPLSRYNCGHAYCKFVIACCQLIIFLLSGNARSVKSNSGQPN